jgi:hypothetical protein
VNSERSDENNLNDNEVMMKKHSMKLGDIELESNKYQERYIKYSREGYSYQSLI